MESHFFGIVPLIYVLVRELPQIKGWSDNMGRGGRADYHWRKVSMISILMEVTLIQWAGYKLLR